MNKIFSYTVGGFVVAMATPVLAFADTLEDVVGTIGDLIDLATPIVVALALVFFFWGLGQYILSNSEAEGKKDAIKIMVWGIIALFVMVSVAGIINVLQDTFNVGGSQTVTAPSVQR